MNRQTARLEGAAIDGVTVAVPTRNLYRRRDVVDARALDKVAFRELATSRDPNYLLIDLTSAKFVDHDALLLLGGLFAERKRHGMVTQLQLPNNASVLDFLRAWDFPEFLEKVAFPSPPLTSSSYAALAERNAAPKPRYISFSLRARGEREPLTLLRSLSITPVKLTQDPWSDATIATDRFLQRNFQLVIERALGKAARSQLADIVRESVLNVSSHPNASMAFTSAHFRPRPIESLDEELSDDAPAVEFQLCVWDDGDSVADTLRRALAETGQIASDRYGEEGVTFDVRIERHPGGEERVELSDGIAVDPDHRMFSELPLLTCAAFMLGISSDPRRQIPNSRPTAARPNSGGVGLAIIRQAALDSRHGRIEYRSGTMRLSVSAADPAQAHYRCEVSVVPELGWPIQGNLLTVTLPMDHAT